MQPIVVSGLINVETTLQVDGFPIPYFPVRYPFFGVHTAVSGVGYNVAKALTVLGNEVRLVSLVGADPAGSLVRQALAADGIAGDFILPQLRETPQSVILYDGEGRRQINVDLKDVQEQEVPREVWERAVGKAEGGRRNEVPERSRAEEEGGKAEGVAVLCNVNFSRPMLRWAKERGLLVATDVHAIGELNDTYNADFMAAADVLFMSHERLPEPPEHWARRVMERYGNAVVVIGLGAEGALLAVRDGRTVERVPAAVTRPVKNTVGAGDALFASFLHVYRKTGDPHLAIRKAVVFASYKVGAAGAAEGFLDEAGLEGWSKGNL